MMKIVYRVTNILIEFLDAIFNYASLFHLIHRKITELSDERNQRELRALTINEIRFVFIFRKNIIYINLFKNFPHEIILINCIVQFGFK